MNSINNKIIYQIALRTFTPEGTLNAAKDLLPYVASLGVDIVYVCPFYAAEDDPDRSTWSIRQIESNTNNPKNPYKMSDYFNVDSEYGTNEDLVDFVDEAHKNGLLVMFDLVYLHCGKSAVFIDKHPDFVERNDDGTVRVPDRWPFARLNFENEELRSYLVKNMELLLTKYNADCFRCDVGDSVPLDFWRNSFRRLKKIKPHLITLNEGVIPEYIDDVFDMGYDFEWNTLMIDVFAKDKSAAELKNNYFAEREKYGDNVKKLIRTIDTHDVASDSGLDRNEIIMTSRGVEAALVITNTFDGTAFMWNGYDVCDNAENNMFSNRMYGRRSALNWSRAFTADGIRRHKFIREIHRLHHKNDAIVNGKICWIDNNAPDEVVSYIKKSDKQSIAVVVNTKNKTVSTELTKKINLSKILMSSNAAADGVKLDMNPYGYIIAEL